MSGTVLRFLGGGNPEERAALGLGGTAYVHGLVFPSGMAIDMVRQMRLEEAATIAEETRICLDQIEKKLQVVGGSLRDVVKITAYAQEPSYVEEMWRSMDEVFGQGVHPKRVTLVSDIGVDCRVEFEAVAVVRAGGGQ